MTATEGRRYEDMQTPSSGFLVQLPFARGDRRNSRALLGTFA